MTESASGLGADGAGVAGLAGGSAGGASVILCARTPHQPGDTLDAADLELAGDLAQRHRVLGRA